MIIYKVGDYIKISTSLGKYKIGRNIGIIKKVLKSVLVVSILGEHRFINKNDIIERV